jgi:putative heme transporter
MDQQVDQPAEADDGRMEHQVDDADVAETPEHPEDPPAPAPKRRWRPAVFRLRREVRWTITVIVLIFVFEYLLLPEIASARRSVKLLGQVSIPLLVLGLALEACALLAYAQLSHTVLSPGAPSRPRLFRINMSSLAVSHVLPVGTASGSALAFRLLGESGVAGSTAAFGLATQGIGSAVVLNLLFWAALVISIPLKGFNPLYGFAAIAGVLLMAIFGATVYLLTKGERGATALLRRVAERLPLVNPDTVASLAQKVADRLQVLMSEPRLVRGAFGWAAANWVLDAASLWVFLWAFRSAVSPIDLLVAYGLANILAVIPITPGGLGIIEGVLIPTLVGFGVPRDVAILGVLTYRFVNFWLPIPLGGAAYLSLRFGTTGRRARSLGTDRPGTAGT